MTTKRTTKEIKARVRKLKKTEFLGFQSADLLSYLEYADAKPFLTKAATIDKWGKPASRDHGHVYDTILQYMVFAWDKANNRRGLSAYRSLEHMTSWLWMIGYDVDFSDYDHYGKPQLRAICEHFRWDWSMWDDGWWTSDELAKGDKPPETVPPLSTYFVK